jgi:branched-subunit amino acid aminotransferase/4-amino-4-deoxychorismate lyase
MSGADASLPQGKTKVDASNEAVLVRNGHADTPWLSKEKLLKEHSGAYTTARTVDQRQIFQFSMHCSRLCNTEMAILQREATEDGHKSQALAFLKAEAAGADKLKPLLAKEVKTALDWLGGESCGKEHQITVLLTCETVGSHTPADRGFDIFTFVQPMPTISPMVDVQAYHAKRKNPTIKDVQWVLDRQHLEELQRKANVNEIVMFDESGFITEGLQTNFFAVTADGAILTAPDERVLAGTVRQVVLEVAAKEGIPVHLQCPNINSATEWESCFICSTSRLVKPICQLDNPEGGTTKKFPDKGSMAHRVEELVREAVREHSEPISC